MCASQFKFWAEKRNSKSQIVENRGNILKTMQKLNKLVLLISCARFDRIILYFGLDFLDTALRLFSFESEKSSFALVWEFYNFGRLRSAGLSDKH